MSTNTYYVNVDSRYRDTEKYPDSTDFAVTFQNFQGTGTFAQGLPLNANSFFEQGSIDPDFDNDNLQIVNGTITTYNRYGNNLIIGGFFTNTMSIMVGSSGTMLYTMPSVNQTSSFVTNISEINTSNYTLNWFMYNKMSTGNSGPVNNTIKTSVQITNDNQLYIMFDFTMTVFDIMLTRDPLGVNVNRFTTVTNPNPIYTYDAFAGQNLLRYLVLPSIFIGLLGLDGSLGYVNGHSYGYHIFNSNTSLTPLNVNGSNSLDIDNSNNLCIGFNTNPYINNSSFSNPVYNINIHPEDYPYGIYIYTGSDGYLYSINSCNMYYSGINSDYGFFYPFNYVISKHTDNSIISSQPLLINPTGTKNCGITNKFVQWSTGVYGIVPIASAMSGALDLTKPSSIYINKIEPYTMSVNNLATINLSYASCIDAYVYNNLIYIFIREALNTFRVYTFNPVTLATSSIASLLLPSTTYYATQMRGYMIGTNVYIFTQDMRRQDPINPVYVYDQFLTGNCYILKFDLLTNGLNLVNTVVSNVPDWYTIEDRGSVKYMYVQSVNKPILQVFNISSPTGVFLANEVTTADFMTLVPFKVLDNGNTNYYIAGTLKVKQGGLYIYNTTDISNIFKYQNIVINSGYTKYVNTNGRFYGCIRLNPALSYKSIIQGDLIFRDTTINSYQYSLNNQNTFSGLSSDYMRHINITIGTNTYCLVFSRTNIKVLDITIMKNIYEYSNIPISLIDDPWYLDILFYNNLIHLVVCAGSNLYFYILSQDANSVTLIDTKTYMYKTVEVHLIIYNNEVICLLSLQQNYIYKLQLDYSLGIIQRSYWNSLVVLSYGIYVASTTVNVFSNNHLIWVGHYSTSNFVPIPGSSRGMFLDFSTDDNNLPYVFTSVLAGGAPAPRGCVKLVNTKLGRYYNVDYVNMFNTVAVYDITNYLGGTNFNTINAGDSYGYCPVFSLNTPNNTYFGFIRSSSTGPKGHYVSFYDISNTNSTVGDSLFFDIGVSSSSGPAISMQLETIITNNNKYILTSLNTGGSMYFYDITNPSFAGNYQQGAFTLTSYTGIQGLNSSIFANIDNEGNSNWMSYLGSNTIPPGENINISNIRLDNTLNELVVSGSWVNNIQSYTYGSGSYSNNISSNTPYYCSYIGKLDLTIGKWKWILPLVSNNDNYIQKVQLLNNHNIIAAGYTYANYLEVFTPQTNNSLPTIQKTIIEANSNASSFIMSFDKNGNILWNNTIYTTDANRYIIIKDCGIQNDTIFVSGVTNASTLLCIDSSGSQTQPITFNIYSPSTQSNIFIYIFDLNGNYLKSEQMVLPNSTSVSLYDIKYYSNNNKFYFCPNVYVASPLGMDIYNADGSIAKTSYYTLNKYVSPIITYYYSNYYVDTNGNSYSKIVYNNPPSYAFTGVNYNNYNAFIVGNKGDTYINKSFSVRTNTITQDTDGNNIYSLILNSIIPINKINRSALSVNGSTGGDKSFSLSASPLQNVISYSSIDALNNSLTIDYYSQSIDITSFYYISFPLQDGTIRNVPIKQTVKTLTNYLIYVEDINQLRIYPSGPFYGPYLYMTSFNKNIYYNLQMFPASLNFPVYYTITLNSLTIPNRPLRETANNFTIKNFNSIPYFYLAIYNTDANDIPDYELVNIVYDNNPNKERFALFQIPTSIVSDSNNWITLSSQVKSKIKFLPTYKNLRIQLFDCYGNKIKFDNTPYKTGDTSYIGGVVPPELMNLNLNFTLQKIV